MTACDAFTWSAALTCAALGASIALPALVASILFSIDLWKSR